MLVVFFVVPFGIMLAVSFFHRVEGGFFEPAFELDNYARFLSAFFGGGAGVLAGGRGLRRPVWSPWGSRSPIS